MNVIKQIKPLSIFLISNKYIYKNFLNTNSYNSMD